MHCIQFLTYWTKIDTIHSLHVNIHCMSSAWHVAKNRYLLERKEVSDKTSVSCYCVVLLALFHFSDLVLTFFLLLVKYIFWTCPENNLVALLFMSLPYWPLLSKQNVKILQYLQYFSLFHVSFCFLWLLQVRTSYRRWAVYSRISAELLLHFLWSDWVLSSCR